MVAPPVKTEGENAPAEPAPMLGEHTDALLNELGYSAENVAQLRRAKVI